ncbi:MAG: hypothetical protein ABIZ72_09650, partial [Candidatus Limnocylindrales bacterium]
MLTRRGTTESPTFTRQDLRRAIVAGTVLVVAMTAVFALDLIPQRLEITVGDVAAADIVAPRTQSFISQIQTVAARAEAINNVDPVYDYGSDKADRIAQKQAGMFATLVVPIDRAFAKATSAEDRAKLLNESIPTLTESARATLEALDAERWKVMKDEASRVLDRTERAELKDTEVEPARTGLVGQMAGLDANERALAAELISPLVLANSSYSQERTMLAQEEAARAVAPISVPYKQNETIVRKGERITDADLEAIVEFGLTESRPDFARLGGWFLLSILVVGILLGWVWRFRRQLWHRTNALVLIGVIVIGVTLLLKLTAGRAGLPFILPTAAAAMLLAILLDAGVATIVIAMIAMLGGAVNGSAGSLELMAYIFLGGMAGIVGIRRGDRFQVFVQAGLAVAIVNVLVVAIFGFLGVHDARGVIELMAASLLSAAGSA